MNTVGEFSLNTFKNYSKIAEENEKKSEEGFSGTRKAIRK